jgi:hypothetical protein
MELINSTQSTRSRKLKDTIKQELMKWNLTACMFQRYNKLNYEFIKFF